MPVPRAPQVTLARDEQSRLESIVRAHSTPQSLAFRCQLILKAAAPEHPGIYSFEEQLVDLRCYSQSKIDQVCSNLSGLLRQMGYGT